MIIPHGNARELEELGYSAVWTGEGLGTREMFTVRKISGGIGVERIFPLHAPVVDKIEVLRRGRVRRTKLYYLRELRGKAARINEKRDERRDDRREGSKEDQARA